MDDSAKDEDSEFDKSLFTVSAQVMERQECGWAPMGNGGISLVEIKKVLSGEDLNEYIVESCSPRHSIKFRCPLGSDTQYCRPTPTFHFWKSRDQRYGLTFSSASQADGFGRAFTQVIQGLSQDTGIHCPTEIGDETATFRSGGGGPHTFNLSSTPGNSMCSAHSWDSSHYNKWRNVVALEDPPVHYYQAEVADYGGVGGRVTGRPLSAVDRKSAPCVFSLIDVKPPNDPPSHSSRLGRWISRTLLHTRRGTGGAGDSHSACSTSRYTTSTPRESYSLSISGVVNSGSQSMLAGGPRSSQLVQRTLVCVYCRRRFTRDNNTPGSCPLAPDRGVALIEQLSCLPCARRMFSSCTGEVDKDAVDRACSCSGAVVEDGEAADGESRCNGQAKRWTLLALISCLLPCLCCYNPLLACYSQSCVACSCLAGKHSTKPIP